MARGRLSPADGWAGDVLAGIDWRQPWFVPWRAWGERAAQEALERQSVAEALNGGCAAADAPSVGSAGSCDGAGAAPIRFVAQSALPPGEAYEAFIARTRQVPTRDGLHDFFNGLCWQRFPRTKRRLNALQAEAIARDGVGATRGPLRDALTLFDENAILLQAPDALWQALQARDWRAVFVESRACWQDCALVLFGHALLEKLVTPYKSITGHVYRLAAQAPTHDDTLLDAWLADDLTADTLRRKPFEPLPVLGVPGWWPANRDAAFYEDAAVFRARRCAASPA